MRKDEIIANARAAVLEISSQCKELVRKVMSGPLGVNEKVGRNTLVGSELIKSVDSSLGEDVEMIRIAMNDYVQYIESGRRPGTWPPPHVIAEWCQRKGIPSDNGTVFLICRSIYEKGIKARPIMDGGGGFWELTEQYFDRAWAEDIFNAITKIIDEYFTD